MVRADDTKRPTLPVASAVRTNAYEVVRRVVEEGAAYGWHRAHKHTEQPGDEVAIDAIADAVMGSLCEVLLFDPVEPEV